jgi:hypothetical protein
MKAPLIAAISILGLLVSDLPAQGGGTGPGGGSNHGGGIRPSGGVSPGGLNRAGGGIHPGVGIRSGGSIGAFRGCTFGRGSFLGCSFFGQGFSSAGFVPWAYAAVGDDFGYPADFFDGYRSQPNVVAPITQRSPEPPAPPPPPPTPFISQYHWPESPAPLVPFSIVGNDGVEHQATSVWVEGNSIHFTSPAEGTRQMPLSSVSRSLTQAANARKNLKLPLP